MDESKWLKEHGAALRDGTCTVVRTDTMCDSENLAVVLTPLGSDYPVQVDFGDSELDDFAAGTPIEDVLKEPAETEFSFGGTLVKLVLGVPAGGKVKVELREMLYGEASSEWTLASNEPFATFEADAP